jgi:hypothetical protein
MICALENHDPHGRVNKMRRTGTDVAFYAQGIGEQFGISRNTAEKHLVRCTLGIFKAPLMRSSRPLYRPPHTDKVTTALIRAESRLQRTWGKKKLRVVPDTRHVITPPPACSAIAELPHRRQRPCVYQTGAHGDIKATHPPTTDDGLQRRF